MKIETFGNNQTESPQDGVSNSGIKAFSNCRDVQGKVRATSLPEVRVFLLGCLRRYEKDLACDSVQIYQNEEFCAPRNIQYNNLRVRAFLVSKVVHIFFEERQ